MVSGAGLKYIGWERLGEEASSMWLKESPHPYWVNVLQVKSVGSGTTHIPVNNLFPMSLRNPSKLIGSSEYTVAESCLIGVLGKDIIFMSPLPPGKESHKNG